MLQAATGPPPLLSLSLNTPMMRQYRAFKEQHPDRLLLFRMGDFFELFLTDAERASELLDLTLTHRGEVPMAGVPAHSLDNYLARLLKLGESVVICDQIAGSDKGGKLMDRQVTRIVTPGTLSEEELLPADNDNLVAAICPGQGHWGLAWMDISHGRLIVSEPQSQEELLAELSRRPPAELLVSESSGADAIQTSTDLPDVVADPVCRPHWEFDVEEGRRRLLEQLGTDDLTAWDCTDLNSGLGALGALLCYAAETLRSQLPLHRLIRERRADLLFIDPATRNSLEIDRSLSGDREATLLAVLDSCCTPMGTRLLRQRLQTPTRRLDWLKERHDAIEALADYRYLDDIRQALKPLGDLARALTRISLGQAPPRDLVRLRNCLAAIPGLAALTADCPAALARIAGLDKDLEQLGTELEQALVEAPPATVRDGGVIAKGYDEELDRLRDISSHSHSALTRMEEHERQRSGIQQLRAGYNRVHGYYLEIPRSRAGDVPADYSARQTLKNSQRYVTPNLKQHEEAVLTSRARALEREAWLYRDLLTRTADLREPLQQLSDRLAELDFLAGQAERVLKLELNRPTFREQPGILVRRGRHPVVEHLQQSAFTPNDLELTDERKLLLITGPNMGGKSTYMRQMALLVLMAHAGCFVAADQAELGPVDRILTRIGASDRLGRGQSTFMVEMTEVAYLLRNATDKSLVLLDEIGRGTGTRDGHALSWACLRWFGLEHPAYTLFATHFVELADTTETLPLADNIHFAAERGRDGEGIRFLHRAEPGPTSHSYGLEVALLAGVPEDFFQLAAGQFAELEARAEASERQHLQGELFQAPPPENADCKKVLDSLRQMDPESLSPRQALDYLYQLKALL